MKRRRTDPQSVPTGRPGAVATAASETITVFVLMLLPACAGLRIPSDPAAHANLVRVEANAILAELDVADTPAFELPSGVEIDTVVVTGRIVEISFNERLTTRPFRTEDAASVYEIFRGRLERYLEGRELSLVALGVPLRELVPNALRPRGERIDSTRIPTWPEPPRQPLVANIDHPHAPTRGLQLRNIAIWPSHGWYYDNGAGRWRWQRLRMFQTVEDLLTLSFAIPYLGPMLENAGAHVFFARERDPQPEMTVVDNDPSVAARGTFRISGEDNWQQSAGGFSAGNPPYPDGHNPFLAGTYLTTPTMPTSTSTIEWVPLLSKHGRYAVYVSYKSLAKSAPDAVYTVHHAGGRTRFRVNQRIGGGTWIYLGTFLFQSSDLDSASVTLGNASSVTGSVVTADAVRFGGGRGIIQRGGTTSRRPRYLEAARYHMQYSGVPDTLVYNLNGGSDDYRDDYQSRGEWVNFLRGAPYGPNRDRTLPGLGIPIDLSLAMHTDAGTRGVDTTIGTLAIYSIEGADSALTFPDNLSRFANRDLADIVQTQFVDDIRALYDSTWTRRALLEAQYSEATRPNVPSLLLELLSHQNPEDAKLGLDPRFRFDASRAIYKGILKFLAYQYGSDYVVQPLPVTHFSATLDKSRKVTLRWRPREDPLEPTAWPQQYVVHTRRGDAGFDNGHLTTETQFVTDALEPDVIYSFKVTAVNEGGEGFPSEILSVCSVGQSRGTVLVVNGFDRLSAPAFVEAKGLRGAASFLDAGVPDAIDYAFTGYQFNFDDRMVWHSDAAPYHGASYADYDTLTVAGNSFDFPFVHGQSISAAGFSFHSSSDESVEAGDVRLADYDMVDLILGEEKKTRHERSHERVRFEAFPPDMRAAITDFVDDGGRLLISGAHVATDLLAGESPNGAGRAFADSVLHITWTSSHASRHGGVYAVDDVNGPFRFRVNTQPDPYLYAAEAPDGLGASGRGARVVLRYTENDMGAGVAYWGNHRTVVLGFPFEVVTTPEDRDRLMRLVLDFLVAPDRER